MRILLYWILCLIPFQVSSQSKQTPIKAGSKNNSQFVNPFIGTGGHGHTYPGATLPFGMVQLSPDTRVDGSWDGCSGYHYSDSIIYGFSHTHLNGTGCSDYGDISLMPANTPVSFNNKSYAASFKHKNEAARAGYYSVNLDNNIDVELTTTLRTGMHRYSFQPGSKSQVVLDLEHRDKALDYFIKIVNDSTVEGYRISEGWAKKQEIYFYLVFNQKFSSKKWLVNDTAKAPEAVKNSKMNSGNFGKIVFTFNNPKHGKLLAKVAISSVSAAGAKGNMQAELPHWDFEKVRNDAMAVWDHELSKIEIGDASFIQKKIFYTALYHCMIQPNIYNDVDGLYRGRDGKVHKANGFDYYSVFSLWDTFRAWHPLMTIIDKKRTLDFIKTFLAQYDQGGLLPVWELSCNETECMIGYHSVSVIADAVSKGITDFDIPKALEAMKKSAESKQRFGLGAYIQNGALSIEDESESVSKTLEYAYDDWCIAQVAKYLNYMADYTVYMQRSQSWKNLFDTQSQFIRPKKNGNFLTPFDPYEVNNNFTEANAWQYTFFVPQDIPGMINAYGGADAFEKKLDELFTAKSQTSGRTQVDITGLIGQYAHGNEPSHHIAYLYNSIGKPTKTTDKVHQILNNFYKNTPDGLIGNEDCGQMSAWYVLSSLGLYQICPGYPVFEFTTPLFNTVILNLEKDKKLIFSNKSKNKQDKYIEKIFSPFPDKSMQVNYSDLIKGGAIIYRTTSSADSALQLYKRDYPLIDESSQIIVNPLVIASENPFADSTLIALKTDIETQIYYTTNGQIPTMDSKLYESPFSLKESATIKAIAVSQNKASKTAQAYMHKLPHPFWKVTLKSVYNPQYSADGKQGLIDGIAGSTDWRKGGWQGYQSQNFEAIIDMNEVKEISKISAHFLQDTRSWIVFPKNVSFEYSTDGKKFIPIGIEQNQTPANDYTIMTQSIFKKFQSVKAQYIRIKAQNFGKLPEWHAGFGGDAFIFIDEITID